MTFNDAPALPVLFPIEIDPDAAAHSLPTQTPACVSITAGRGVSAPSPHSDIKASFFPGGRDQGACLSLYLSVFRSSS